MSLLDACVIGAGAAGLVAAKTLATAGLSVRVLEARPRAGGRAWTDWQPFGVPIDRGGAWLHSADRNPWTTQAREHGFSIIERAPDWQRRIGREPLSPERRARWDADWDAAEAAIQAAAEAGRDVSAADVIPDGLEFRTLFDAIMTWAIGVDTPEISTVDYWAYDSTDTNWSVREGLGAVVASAAQGLDLAFGCPVLGVDWGGPEVRIETQSGTLDCRAVVVTVPMAVLAEGRPRFAPELPAAYGEAFANLPLGVANKVFVELTPGAIPLPGTTHVIASADTTRTMSITMRPAGHELISAYFGGSYSRELEAAGELEDATRAELVRLFGANLGGAIRRMSATAWRGDPWARGSYSVARPGYARCRRTLAEPVGERVFFAGEACSIGGFGTMHGAWESGAAAASRVITALRR